MEIPGAISYVFDGIGFYRKVDEGFMPWIHPQLTYDVAPILDANQVYIDTGGVSPIPFEVIGAFATRAERLATIRKVGTVATLEKTGFSTQVLLAAAQAQGLGDTGFWFAALTFIATAPWPWIP
jgi:hypothetical protein